MLAGPWQAAVADEATRRAYPDPDFDDASWTTLEVPGHWRSAAAFDATDGPLLMRRRFEHPRIGTVQRAWLTFEGIFYQADVWLDGSYVGDTEGYFAPHTFEVTDALRDRSEHALAIEVTCEPERDRTAKRNLTGVFQHWDCLDPDWNPGGIWRPVHVRTTGRLALTGLRVLCLEANAERAVLALEATVDSAGACEARVRTRVTSGAGSEHDGTHRLAKGENRVAWNVTVDRPQLWWPHALGPADLVDVVVSVEDDDGESDRRSLRTGIREVRMKAWVASINGERLFLKGSNHGPSRMALAGATAAELERDVVLAKQANLDFLRLHAHITRPEFYDQADRHGLLLWQDLPLQGGYSRSVRKQAVRQARQAVDVLGHHPSIALWCGHNEPIAPGVDPSRAIDVGRMVRKTATSMALPTYSRTILDGSVHRALEKADRSRPVVAHSGLPGRTDSHLYFGWYHGHERDLPRFAAAWPRAVRFVTEFGAQAVPATDGFLEPEKWPDLEWEHLARTHNLQRQVMARNGLDPTDFQSFDAWRDATQMHQATVLKHHAETLRRLKYRPAGGFATFSFADGWPGVTWSVLDHERVPKPGYVEVRNSCRPVIVVADRLHRSYRPADPIALDVHVVSDLRRPLEGAVVEAALDWPGGGHAWRWSGDVPADSVVRVGTVQAIAPDAPGPMGLTLRLTAPGVDATNEYSTTVTRDDSAKS